MTSQELFGSRSGGADNGNERVIAYWFVPLPEPVALPDGAVFEFGAPGDLSAFIEHAAEAHETGRGGSLPPPGLVSLRVRQDSEPWADPYELSTVIRVAREALSLPTGPPAQPSAEASLTRQLTVVEVAVTLPELAGSPDEGVISDAFDRGLRCVRSLQQAYNYARIEPLRLASRELLPPAIPYALRRVTDHADDWPQELSIYLLNTNLQSAMPLEPLDEQDQVALRAGLRQIAEQGAFTGYIDLRREALLAFEREGDYRSAVIFAATSAEVCLDDLLMHLLWEEAVRPEDAAPLFTNPRAGLANRVRTEYTARLAGDWSLVGDGALAGWAHDIAAVRHRVIHSGYYPDIKEAQAALAALHRLEQTLGDLLAGRVHRYPRTAYLYCGERGLRRRGSFTRRVQQLAEDTNEPNWSETFVRWRDVVARRRADRDGLVATPDPARANLVVVVHPDGREDWVLHERAARMAARTVVDYGALPTKYAEFLRQTLAELTAQAQGEVFSTFVQGAPPMRPAEPWVEEYRRIPFTGAMINGADLD